MNTKRRITTPLAVLILVIIAAVEAIAGGSTVRGRLVREGNYPAAGVEVSLLAVNTKLGRSSRSYSGTDGMYYIRNVPPGEYDLELWVAKEPVTYRITVRDGEYTDIAPIVLR